MNDVTAIRQSLQVSIEELASMSKPSISFEFFPPKDALMEQKLWETIHTLEGFNPNFVSVTYGAGGSTRERTHRIVTDIAKQTQLKPAAHLTCVGASKKEINAIIEQYWESGIRHIVALRGDYPDGIEPVPHPDGYHYANELVEGIKKIADFDISVAAYPEKHPQAASLEEDIDHLKRKIDAGANRAITQYFFDTRYFLEFLEKTAKAGIDVPIIPGILPITNYKQAVKFSQQCQVTIPDWVHHLFAGLDNIPLTRNLVAAVVAAEQCRQLRKEGINELHFYTLNRAELSYAICHILGVRSTQQQSQVDA